MSYKFTNLEIIKINYAEDKMWIHTYISEWSSVYEYLYCVVLQNEKEEQLEVFFVTDETPEEVVDSTFLDVIYVALNEDVWTISPPAEKPFKNSKEYAEFMNKHMPKQFIFTEEGEEITKFFDGDDIEAVELIELN